MQAPYPNPCAEMLLSFRHCRSQWLQQCCLWEKNWAPLVFPRRSSHPPALKQVRRSDTVSSRDLFHISWEVSTDGGFTPHLSKLSSSPQSFCRVVLPFFFPFFFSFFFPFFFSAGDSHSEQHFPSLHALLELEAVTIPSPQSCNSLHFLSYSLLSSPFLLTFHKMWSPNPWDVLCQGTLLWIFVDFVPMHHSSNTLLHLFQVQGVHTLMMSQPTLWKTTHSSLRIHFPLLFLS